MSEQSTQAIFDEWNEVVDCNECSRYWDSSCDAVDRGVKRTCNSFLATRSVVIPSQIKALNDLVKWLIVAHICSWAAIAILTIVMVGNG